MLYISSIFSFEAENSTNGRLAILLCDGKKFVLPVGPTPHFVCLGGQFRDHGYQAVNGTIEIEVKSRHKLHSSFLYQYPMKSLQILQALQCYPKTYLFQKKLFSCDDNSLNCVTFYTKPQSFEWVQ